MCGFYLRRCSKVRGMDKKAELKKFKEASSNIISKMVQVLMRAQRKVDDRKYRETIDRLKKMYAAG